MPTRTDYTIDGRAEAGACYRHYKGGLYVVVCEATEESSLQPVVVYRNAEGRAWTRPVHDFFGEVSVDGTVRQRFVRVMVTG